LHNNAMVKYVEKNLTTYNVFNTLLK
jgi:hypothetical protein